MTAISRHSNQLFQHALLITAAGDITDIPWLTSRQKDRMSSSARLMVAGKIEFVSRYRGGNQAILQAVQKSMVKRFIVVGGAGSLKIASGIDLIDSPIFLPK